MASHSTGVVSEWIAIGTQPWNASRSSSIAWWFSPTKITSLNATPCLKNSPNSIGSMAMAPMITDGIASSTSGSVTTHGDSCGFSPGARPW
ncbi:hypothetical protein D3C72_1155130 [compost metagenome]